MRTVLCAITLITLVYLPSQAIAVGPPTVLTFDDINAGTGYAVPMPSGYGGVSWPNNAGVYGASQPPYLAQSLPNRALFNLDGSFGGVFEYLVSFIGGPKIFDGAYFSGTNTIQFRLYSGVTLVGTSSVLNLGDSNSGGSGPTFLASGYAGPVSKVGIVGTRGYFVMDNFTFEEVPEPPTLLLLAIGAISLLGYRQTKSS